MQDKQAVAPEGTALRVALWRALHVEADAAPHVFSDVIGLALAAPAPGWQQRPDMSPFTRPFRASMVLQAVALEWLWANLHGTTAVLGVWLAMGKNAFLLDWLKTICPPLGFIRFPIKYVLLPLMVLPFLAACSLGGNPLTAPLVRWNFCPTEHARENLLGELAVGDMVVHVEHGIAQYQGLVRRRVDGGHSLNAVCFGNDVRQVVFGQRLQHIHRRTRQQR